MSSPAKKASTGGIRKTTIKNNLYLKNRAALRPARFFYLTDHFFYQEPPYRDFGCFMNRTGSLHPEAMMDHGCQKAARDAPVLPKRSLNGTSPKHLSAANDPRKKTRILAVFFYTTYLCFRSLFFARRRISGASGMFMPCDPQRCRYAHRGVGPRDEADQHDQREVSRGIAAEEVE